MTRTGEADPKSLYMKQGDAAETLGVSPSKVGQLINAGELRAVTLGENGRRRVVRASLEAYCARIEAEGAKRFGGAA